jgi:hypothetical protein
VKAERGDVGPRIPANRPAFSMMTLGVEGAAYSVAGVTDNNGTARARYAVNFR